MEETGSSLHLEEEYIYPGGELIARIEGERPVSYAQVVKRGGREKTSTQEHSLPKSMPMVLAGSKQMKGSTMGEVVAGMEVAPAVASQAKHSALEEMPKRQVSAVSLTTINAKQELCNFRDWLGRLRGEVEAGIGRLDEVISNLNITEAGQRSRETGRIFQSKRFFKPKRSYWAGKKRWVRKFKGESSGSGPNEMEKPLGRGEDSIEHTVSLEGTACLDNFERHSEVGSPVKMMAGVERRSVEDPGESGRMSGGSGKSAEGMGSLEEEDCTSRVKDIEDGVMPVVGAEEDALLETQRGREPSGEIVGGGEEAATFHEGPCGINEEGQNREGRSPKIAQGPREVADSDQHRGRRSPETTQTRSMESFRSGYGLVVVQNREGRTPEFTQGLREEYGTGQYREWSSPELAQRGSKVSNRAGHGRQVTGEVSGLVSAMSLVTRGGSMPETTQLGDMPGILGAFGDTGSDVGEGGFAGY
ncbi:hypothetical protein FH972_002054 [Carpinus fangiana]|uniref:Uncharacterized protein n=1 Tax=Carpinus fangiana TaxID=176857 RepID=A0A5N6QE63_9ROSI|nr:hypothetical protein FH972_002054 [Carpinus fangiana]